MCCVQYDGIRRVTLIKPPDIIRLVPGYFVFAVIWKITNLFLVYYSQQMGNSDTLYETIITNIILLFIHSTQFCEQCLRFCNKTPLTRYGLIFKDKFLFSPSFDWKDKDNAVDRDVRCEVPSPSFRTCEWAQVVQISWEGIIQTYPGNTEYYIHQITYFTMATITLGTFKYSNIHINITIII